MNRAGMGANVSEADVFIWLCRQHGYSAFLKVPCCARPHDELEATSPHRFDHKYSTWYLPLASPHTPYAPTGIDAMRMGFIQDLLIVDASETRAIATLQDLGRRGCFRDWCCSKRHSKGCRESSP